jgi:hypothetical protein
MFSSRFKIQVFCRSHRIKKSLEAFEKPLIRAALLSTLDAKNKERLKDEMSFIVACSDAPFEDQWREMIGVLQKKL